MSLRTLMPHLMPFQILSQQRIDNVLHLYLRARRPSADCPGCHHPSLAVHSHYQRTVADLPLSGSRVVLHLEIRRFFCRNAVCPRRLFAERFPDLVGVRRRHSVGVEAALRQVGLAVGGRAGAPLAHALGLGGSVRTILRLVHTTRLSSGPTLRVIGIDEWAWRRGQRYGTLICDLERHRVVELLPDRSASSVARWLHHHPRIEVVCRDRSGLFADGIRQGAPQAIQVVDRFHLLQNLRDALERFFLHHRPLLKTLGQPPAETPPAALLPKPIDQVQERPTESELRHERFIRLYEQIHDLSSKQVSPTAIARHLQISRPTVYRYASMTCPPERKQPRRGALVPLDPFKPYLLQRWNEGCRNAQQLWRELVAQGYRQSPRTVGRFVGHLRSQTGTRFKFGQAPPALLYEAAPSAQPRSLTALQAARLFLAKAEERPAIEQELLALLLEADPLMQRTYHQVQTFCQMVRHRQGQHFDEWVAQVQQTGTKELRSFVKGLLKDEAAVRAGLSLDWSNGPTEGYIHRLKLLKRQAYGRAGVAFLRQRVLAPQVA